MTQNWQNRKLAYPVSTFGRAEMLLSEALGACVSSHNCLTLGVSEYQDLE